MGQLRLPEFKSKNVAIATQAMPEVPAFDASAHYAEIGGMEGIKYLQGRNYFSAGKHFVAEAPKHQWQPEETLEQKRNRQKKMAADARLFARPLATAQIPQKVLDAERENAQARAAESHAA